jgi:hypothetical protein
MTVLSASTQKAPTNIVVVHGWPGVRNRARSMSIPRASRRRKTNSAAPVRPKKSASIATT